MKVNFCKYQGTGNDFVMVDNRQGELGEVSVSLVKQLCDRKFGIGADGLITIEEHPELDFTMVYWNADGSQSFCGNGSRCTVAFAHRLCIIEKTAHFLSTDGPHKATILEDGWVSLEMHDVSEVEQGDDFFFIDTGSPHYIKYVTDTKEVDVVTEGRAVRYNDRFKAEGTNVNFVTAHGDGIVVRTYERGVEDETLSCGTGVTAAALSASEKELVSNGVCPVETMGGSLQIRFNKTTEGYRDIRLEGPATFVYSGVIDV